MAVSEGQGTFIAHATHPSLGEEVAEGRVDVNMWRLRFEGTSNPIEIPLNHLEIETGENGEIYFSDSQAQDLVIYTFDARILQAQALSRHAHTRPQIRALRSQDDLKRRLRITGWCLGGFAGMALIVTVAMGFIVKALVARVPPQWEQKLGNDRLAELKATATFMSDPKLLAKLDQAVKPLIDSLPTNQVQAKYQFYLM